MYWYDSGADMHVQLTKRVFHSTSCCCYGRWRL